MEDDKAKLLHGQALALQWVGFAMQKLTVDVSAGGSATKQLPGDAIRSNKDLDTLALGCTYTVNFVLPFAAELGFKALITKEGQRFERIHELLDLYTSLSQDTRQKLQREFENQRQLVGSSEIRPFEDILAIHNSDFPRWRYLTRAETLQKEEKELHVVISTILVVYPTI
jgi:hypothetical protein